MWKLTLLLLALPGLALAKGAPPSPFVLRGTGANQDLGALNQNLQDITGSNRDRLVPIVGDQDCSLINQGVLIGATEKGGYLFGGTCQSFPALVIQNSTITTSSEFTGTGSPTNPLTVNAISETKITNLVTDLNAIHNSTAVLSVLNPPYSAVCDGSTNDAVALQACITDAGKFNIPCQIPAKTCATSSPLFVTSANTRIYGIERSSSTILFNTAGGGSCAIGVNGALQNPGFSGMRIQDLSLKANNASLDCIVNVSSTVGNTAIIYLTRDTIDPGTNTVAKGLYFGNLSTMHVEDSYFAPGLSTSVYDAGTFTNGVSFERNFFDTLTPGGTNNFMLNLGTCEGCQIRNNTFEAGPNGIRISNGVGTEVSGSWMGDVVAASGTWISVSGSGNRVIGNYLQSTSAATKQTAVKVSGTANTVANNRMESPDFGVIAIGTGNAVTANSIYFPNKVAVEVGTGTASFFGPNDLSNISGSVPGYACDASAQSERIIETLGFDPGNCDPRANFSVIENIKSLTFDGHSYSRYSSTSATSGVRGIFDNSAHGATYGTEIVRFCNGPGGVSAGSGQCLDIEVNSGNNGPFDAGTYSDTFIRNRNGRSGTSGSFGNFFILHGSSVMFRLGSGTDFGYKYIGGGVDVATFSNTGSLFLAPGASMTASSYYGDGAKITGIPSSATVQNLQVFESTAGPRLAAYDAFLSTAGPWMQSSAASSTTFATYISTAGPWMLASAASSSTFATFLSTAGPWMLSPTASSMTANTFYAKSSTSPAGYVVLVSSQDGTTILSIKGTGGVSVTDASGLNTTYGVVAGSITVGGTALTANVVSGNVGIGTANPAYKLHLSSGLIYNDGNTGGFFTNAPGSALAGPGAQVFYNGGVAFFNGPSASSIYNSLQHIWQNAGAEAARITTGGNLVINTAGASAPNRLEVNGNVAIGSYAGVNPAPANSLIVSGQLGVGTANPAAKTTIQSAAVNASTATVLRLVNPGAGINTGATLEMGYGDTETAANSAISGFYDGTGGVVALYTGATSASVPAERMRIDHRGSVGLGTPSPCSTCAFEGVGNLSFTGNGNFASITSTGLASVQNVQVKSIASGTQCLHADASGNITGTGADCSSGTGASLSSTQTFSGANNFTSSMTWAAGTYINGISVSTCGALATTTSFTGNSTFNQIAGSTLTWTSHGGYPLFNFKLWYNAWANPDIICLKVYVDGGTNGTYTDCDIAIQPASGGSHNPFNFIKRGTTALSPGSHSFSVWYNTNNANGVAIPYLVSGSDSPQICVYDNQ